MEPGEMKYGVPNIVYDIIQTVGNLLQGVEKMLEYAGDAEAAGERGADDAPFSGVRELVEVLEGGKGELGGSARLPIPRFRIPASECGSERRSVAARAKFAERLSSVTR